MTKLISHDTAWREFHVARPARDRYQFDQTFFATNGNVLFANFQAARLFAQRMNEGRDLARFPDLAVRAGQLNALGLIDEILHYIFARYREEQNPAVLTDALSALDAELGAAAVDATLRQFTEEFPPVAVYRGLQTEAEYLAGQSAGVPNRQLVLEELLLLWINNVNPATQPFTELLDDASLETQSAYLPLIGQLQSFFATQPFFGPDNQSLMDMLRAPALASPDSLEGQLKFLLSQWGDIAGPFLRRLLTSADFIEEEQKPVFPGPGPALVPSYRRGRGTVGLDEPERFSPDKDWMPNAVLMAKNTYVWMDQLSRQYGRAIRRLDQIPDEELDALAQRGFTGLWLIGLWERSVASERIKKMCGNDDAVASAYSLHDYVIAADLGGPEAMSNLAERGWQRGLRMASDMVPNHMAIDSRWVVEHPDWFIALDHAPFPTYTFNGVNLSRDERVGIYLEDHYYSRSDAAVVFKRVDHHTGNTRYVYHGNDGTSMPWNDTAQLNYLNSVVREGVIQTILHVARQFPIIRFDAAMTLAKRHYQRLWFPEPGTGGAIPSRAEYGLDSDQFNAAFPEEFWREVVDRVAQEVPDTLLLAEAFWMMEGYFVRTLGMHRVYNSAFMNMLRDEENQNYRLVLKNTLEFDPDILKRFVNFMNNPDEKTAVEQFGNGDKYFGVCTLMATLPGLPMFGHGQIEGFAEKYGMEYQRAYWDEQADPYLVERHEREIFPLLRARHVFAEVQNFLLFDFWTDGGHVNEDVYAYSNRAGHESALVVYHNKYAEANGWVRTSVGAAVKGEGGTKQIVQQTLGQGLGLSGGDNWFTTFRDNATGLEYIRASRDLIEQGLYVELQAYATHVFLDFQETEDNAEQHYRQLANSLAGRGVPSIRIALRELELQPILDPFRRLSNPAVLRHLTEQAMEPAPRTPQSILAANKAVLNEIEDNALQMLQAISDYQGPAEKHTEQAEIIANILRQRLGAALTLPHLTDPKADAFLRSRLDEPTTWHTLLSWTLVCDVGRLGGEDNYRARSRASLDEFLLGHVLTQTLQSLGLSATEAAYQVSLIKVLPIHHNLIVRRDEDAMWAALSELFEDEATQQILAVNEHQQIQYFNKEAFEQLLWWLFAATVLDAYAAMGQSADKLLSDAYKQVLQLKQAAQASGYQVARLLKIEPAATPSEAATTASLESSRAPVTATPDSLPDAPIPPLLDTATATPDTPQNGIAAPANADETNTKPSESVE